ncbi:MAG: cupredoxin domain-containing protein [Acidimicrobiia bacterium]
MTDVIDTAAARTTATTTWMKLARAGAITMVVWSVVLQAILAREVIPPVLVIGAIYLVAAPFLKGERRRLGLALAVVTAILFTGNLGQIADSLAAVTSAPGWVMTWLSTVTAVVGVGAGLGAFFQWRADAVRVMAVGTASVFVLGALVSVAAAVNTESDAPLATDIRVTAEKVEFAPEAISFDAGSGGVWVDNRDGIHHTFTIAQLGIDLEIPAFKAKRIDIGAPPGTYGYACTVPGHEGMVGVLTIIG